MTHPQPAKRRLSSRILGIKGAAEPPQRSSSAPQRSSSSLSNRIIDSLGGSKGKLSGYALNVTEDVYDDDEEENDTLEVRPIGPPPLPSQPMPSTSCRLRSFSLIQRNPRVCWPSPSA